MLYVITEQECKDLELELALEAALAKLERGEISVEEHFAFIQQLDAAGEFLN